MAQHPCTSERAQTAASPTPTHHELTIQITLDFDVTFEGCAAALADEGLLPAGQALPKRDQLASWECAGFHYNLRRCRPAGLKGAKSLWVNGDHWRLQRYQTGVDFFESAAASRQRAIRELQAFDDRAVERHEECRRFCDARADAPFQSFKSSLLSFAAPSRGVRANTRTT